MAKLVIKKFAQLFILFAFVFVHSIYQPLNRTHIFYSLFLSLQEVPDENYDLPYNQNETNGDAVMIKMDVPSREEPSFPKEKWKTFIGKLGILKC